MDPVRFRGSATAQLGPIAVVLLLAVSLIWRSGMRDHHQFDGFGYFGVAFIVIVVGIAVPNIASPPTLSLDESGFTWKSWRKTATFYWSDIDRFLLGKTIGGGREKIAFNFRAEVVHTQRGGTQLNRTVNGYDRSMANVWNISSVELVDMLNDRLNRWRTKAS